MGNAASHSTTGSALSSIGRKTKTEAALAAGGIGAASPSGAAPALRNFTLEQLAEFNGERGKPVYVSVLGDVYDVTSDLAEYTSGESKVLAGRDASRALATMSLVPDEAANTDLSDLSPAQLESLREWERKFQDDKQYPKVGRLLLPTRSYTRDELRPFNGVDNVRRTVLVGLAGSVYDVTLHGWEHYGPGGSYAQFAGRDASRALACMSFLDEYLDDPTLDELSPEQRDALANWATRFDTKYPVVGKLASAGVS